MSQELEDLFGNIDFVNDPDRGAGILLEWIKHSPNIVGLVQAIMPEIQELNDAQQSIFSTINIFEAVGPQLDDIFGEILNLERVIGQTDDDYRTDLLAKYIVLSQSGEILVMKSLYRSLTVATSISLHEYQPAAFKLSAVVVTLPSQEILDSICVVISKAKQGGNNVQLTITDKPPFTLYDDSNSSNDSLGLSSDSVDGGYLVMGFEFPKGTTPILGLDITSESGDLLITESGEQILTQYRV